METPHEQSLEAEGLFRQIVLEERALLRFILRYIPAVSDARDVLQETLVTLWEKRAEFDATKELLPWACGIARLKIREFWRKQPRWSSFANGDVIQLIDARRAVLDGELSLRAEKLRTCLMKLPVGQRTILQRYYAQDESVENLALREGRSTDAIYKLIQRIRGALLECVERSLRSEGVAL